MQILQIEICQAWNIMKHIKHIMLIMNVLIEINFYPAFSINFAYSKVFPNNSNNLFHTHH